MSPTSLISKWNSLNRFPGGNWLFNFLLGFAVPYSGSIKARVKELNRGYCKIELRDRRAVRNHLQSIHAMAIANLGELATGLSTLSQLDSNCRAIVTKFSVEYLKKSRGKITATCKCPSLIIGKENEIEGILENEANECVARVKAVWLVSPTPPKTTA